ncbi:MAG TPA: NAD-dependent deacylase [Smithellaceae bacterium]|nr:NAD-dependent deacylase [Smithellaceae bacterium]
MENKIKKSAALIKKAHNIAVFTGAGVSTESGIPDFRSQGGFWTRFDPDDFTIDKFLSSVETRKRMWKILQEEVLLREAEPNAAHLAIAELEKMGKVKSVITQNIDNLHQKAGNSPSIIFELHGNMNWLICLGCGRRYPVELAKQCATSADDLPECRSCYGILKPDLTFFGEPLPEKAFLNAMLHAQECDLFIVIGSSLLVYPAADIPLYAKRAGAKIVIINISETQQDEIADVIINQSAGKTMTRIMERLKELEK